MKYIAIAVIVLLLAGCNSLYEDDARREMHRQGYSDVQFGDMTFFGCFKGAHFNAKFTAKNSAGTPTKGVVCGYSIFGYSVRVKR